MKLLLYGGTFDPPHYGHINNLCAAAGEVYPDRILIMPAGVPPHKQASATPPELRLEMCKCFARLKGQPGIAQVEICDWEIQRSRQGLPNYTVETLLYLRQQYPEAQLYLTVGSDMLLTFDKWVRWQEILQLATLVTVSRDYADREQLLQAKQMLEAQGGTVLLPEMIAMPMASSEIRSGALGWKSCCPPETVAVIEKHGLYAGTVR